MRLRIFLIALISALATFPALAEPPHYVIELDLTTPELKGSATITNAPDDLALSAPFTLTSEILEGTIRRLTWTGPTETALDYRTWSSWLPRSQTEGFFTYELTLRTTLPQKAIATGSFESDRIDGEIYEARFSSPAPMPELTLFAGPFEITERRAGRTVLRTYFQPGSEDMAETYLTESERYLTLYEDWIGPFPFKSFSIISASDPVGLGYPGLTYIGERVLRLPFIVKTSLGHELLHNYWGNGVFPDYRSGNWSEGLTTYMADYEYARQEGPEKAHEMRLAWLRDFAALPPERDRPARSFISKSHDASQVIGYYKTAFLFHMLQRKIGSDTFNAGIRLFWQDYAFKRASWDDIARTFSTVAGQDLKPFFDEWLDRTGAPLIDPAEDPDHHMFRQLAPGEAPPILRDVLFQQEVDIIILAAADEAFTATARGLAGRLIESGGTFRDSTTATRPALIIGKPADLPEPPSEVKDQGAAQVWAAYSSQLAPRFYVAAQTADALAALMRPLPHYGRRSYLAFEGSTAIVRGTWTSRQPAGQ